MFRLFGFTALLCLLTISAHAASTDGGFGSSPFTLNNGMSDALNDTNGFDIHDLNDIEPSSGHPMDLPTKTLSNSDHTPDQPPSPPSDLPVYHAPSNMEISADPNE